ncbi:TPA: hypothetical protein I8Y09_000931 [Raoultella ornithinolytica]|nr:hypothetical protein [Raoultella ornithinolytica]
MQRLTQRVSVRSMSGQVKGQAGQAEGLIFRKGCPPVLFGDYPRNRGEFFLHVGLLVRMPKIAVYPMAIGGTLKEKAAILADDAIDRPHSDPLIAPSCRGVGDGYYPDTGRLQPL